MMLCVLLDMQRFQAPYNLKAIPEVQEYLNVAFEKSKHHGDLQDLYRRRYAVMEILTPFPTLLIFSIFPKVFWSNQNNLPTNPQPATCVNCSTGRPARNHNKLHRLHSTRPWVFAFTPNHPTNQTILYLIYFFVFYLPFFPLVVCIEYQIQGVLSFLHVSSSHFFFLFFFIFDFGLPSMFSPILCFVSSNVSISLLHFYSTTCAPVFLHPL